VGLKLEDQRISTSRKYGFRSSTPYTIRASGKGLGDGRTERGRPLGDVIAAALCAPGDRAGYQARSLGSDIERQRHRRSRRVIGTGRSCGSSSFLCLPHGCKM